MTNNNNQNAARMAKHRAIKTVVGATTGVPNNQPAAVLNGALNHPSIKPILGDVLVTKDDPKTQLSLQCFQKSKQFAFFCVCQI